MDPPCTACSACRLKDGKVDIDTKQGRRIWKELKQKMLCVREGIRAIQCSALCA